MLLKKTIRYFLVPFVILIALYFFGYRNVYGYVEERSEVEKQVNHLVAMKDVDAIKQVGMDTETIDFLMQVPSGSTCEKLTDSQGVTPDGAYYFAGLLHGQAIQLYVREKSTTQGLFTPKKWELVRIGLQSKNQSR